MRAVKEGRVEDKTLEGNRKDREKGRKAKEEVQEIEGTGKRGKRHGGKGRGENWSG